MTILNWVLEKKWMMLLCCLLVAMTLSCVPKAPKERPATLVIQPASAKAGQVIVIKGYEFLPNEEVEVIMTIGDVYHALGTGKADTIVVKKDGTFEVSSGVPVRTSPGTYKVEASGNKGSVGSCNITVVK
jgi:hypothetical protein